jgi:DNA-binding MarR family transcriptional regulator
MHIKSPFNPDYQNNNIDAKIVVALEKISEAFRVLLWEVSKEFNLTPIQVQILIFLKTHRDEFHTVSYLSREFNMSKPTISDSIKTLEKKHLIIKISQKSDIRSFIVKLTRKGHKIASTATLLTQTIENSLKHIPRDTKKSIFALLTNTIATLNKAGIVSIQRMCFSCIYYKYNVKENNHYCNFLEKKLLVSDIRLDCNEHKPKA